MSRGSAPPRRAAAVVKSVALIGAILALTVLLSSGTRLLGARTWVREPPAVPGGTPPPLPPKGGTAPSPPIDLPALVPRTVEGFEATRVRPAPGYAETFEAKDAVDVEYRDAAGTRIRHYLFTYANAVEAKTWQKRYVDALGSIGYLTVARSVERGLVADLLKRDNEAVVWSHGPLVAVIEGPYDVATSFFLDLPY